MLPLLADVTPIAVLPAYLSAVTVLAPTGDAVAELVDAVSRLRERRRRLWLRRSIVAGAVLLARVGATVWLARPAQIVDRAELNNDNSHVMHLKNGHQVRLTGSLVRNDSNVPCLIIRKYIEWVPGGTTGATTNSLAVLQAPS